MAQFEHQYYEEFGEGFAVVLLHGNSSDRRVWEDVVPLLAGHFRVITPDMAGFGLSAPAPDGVAITDDLARLLDHLGVRQAAVAGLSLGGGIAISFALHHPERCAALIAVDAAPFGWHYTDWATPKPYVLKARSEGLAAGLAAWLADPLFTPAMASPAAARVREVVMAFPGYSWLQRTTMIPPGPPEVDRLGEIKLPTLALVGELDLPDFQRIAARLEADIPGARKIVVDGAGHMLPMEKPAAVAAQITEFLTPLAEGR